MSSQQAPLFIKIKHANSTRKVRVPNQPAPVWSKLSAAIVGRFGIPEGQPIGLQYLDPEGDIITISSQVEFDELWHEITLAAKPNQKGGVDQRTLSLELILIDHQPTQPKPSSDLTKVHHPEAGSISTEGSTFQLIPTPVDGSSTSTVDPASDSAHLGPAAAKGNNPIKGASDPTPGTAASDPPEYPINTSPSPNSRSPLVDSNLGLSALITAIDAIAPKLQDTLGGYAQMIVQVSDQLSDTCRVIASHLKEPSTQAGPNPRPAPFGERYPSAHPTSAPRMSPSHVNYGFTPASDWNPSGPTAPPASVFPCSSPQAPLWFTRPPLGEATHPNAFYPSVPREKKCNAPSYAKHSFGFGNTPDKDRINPTIFSHDYLNVPRKSFVGGVAHVDPWAYFHSANPKFESNSPNSPDKIHFGAAGFGNVRGKGKSGPSPIFANNSPSSPVKTKFSGVGNQKSREKGWNSFTPPAPINAFNLAGRSNFGCTSQENLAKHSPAPSSDLPKTFSPINRQKKKQSSDFSDDETNGWLEPPNANKTGGSATKGVHGKTMAEQAATTSPRANDVGGIEKKKGPVSWADMPDWQPPVMGRGFVPKFKSRNPSTRKAPSSFPDLEEASDDESLVEDGWGPKLV
ncbi:hypothetical protein PGTUg99_010658 [Puccinia graminis f. sp. tritici]|uniref:PB1 domain-containing protein n=1 Tax=Puccinia graminis f. sp. tritici TaxID=56615 RepID=A0A5B0MS39_PUCGR|nr:hypothetical protein PGTUg99_010658 [Puccinia graminis f. sp. tritici]